MKFFVSYSNTDAPDIAEGIHKYFRPPNYEVFVSNIDIRAGDIWEREIEDNLMNCDVFVIVVTRGALDSKYIEEKEIPKAIELGKRIIPCRFKGIPREDLRKYRLYPLQSIDFVTIPDLLRQLEAEIRKDVKTLGETLRNIDIEIPKMKAQTGRKSPRAGIIAEVKDDTIIFRHTEFNGIRSTITPDKFKTLDSQSRDLPLTYERSMLNGFEKWKALKIKRHGKLMKFFVRIRYGLNHDELIQNQLGPIVEGICSDWSKIVEQLNRFGIGLEDHYYGIYGICDDYGYVTRVRG